MIKVVTAVQATRQKRIANILGFLALLEMPSSTDEERAIVYNGLKSSGNELDLMIREITKLSISASYPQYQLQ